MKKLMVYHDRCRHFTGIQHKACAAGVEYVSVRDSSQKGPYKWPCLDGGWSDGKPATTTCAKLSNLTQEEHAAHEAEITAAVDKAMSATASGKCHVCGASAEPSAVVGRCRYNACGHRRGQE